MSEELFSPSWYRVATLKPRLRNHIRIHQHQYRGETWYVLQDTVTGRHHRFTPVAHEAISMMDGQHDVQMVWDTLLNHLGDDAPTQGEMIHLLAQLHAVDALQCDITPDTEELFRRYQQSERRNRGHGLGVPERGRFDYGSGSRSREHSNGRPQSRRRSCQPYAVLDGHGTRRGR